MKHVLAVIPLTMLVACTTPADVSRPESASNDKNAKVNLAKTDAGFTVDVRYSRYQFVPESGALLAACKSIVIARAADEAKARGREIVPIDEQAIRVSTGRNILSGRTACQAFADVRWKQ